MHSDITSFAIRFSLWKKRRADLSSLPSKLSRQIFSPSPPAAYLPCFLSSVLKTLQFYQLNRTIKQTPRERASSLVSREIGTEWLWISFRGFVTSSLLAVLFSDGGRTEFKGSVVEKVGHGWPRNCRWERIHGIRERSLRWSWNREILGEEETNVSLEVCAFWTYTWDLEARKFWNASQTCLKVQWNGKFDKQTPRWPFITCKIFFRILKALPNFRKVCTFSSVKRIVEIASNFPSSRFINESKGKILYDDLKNDKWNLAREKLDTRPHRTGKILSPPSSDLTELRGQYVRDLQ